MSNDTHNLSGTRVYRAWAAMHNRCYNEKNRVYARYGGRGITVCPAWNSLEQFLVDMGHPPAELTIDRIDNDGNYEPGNCKWATQEEQNENTVRNRYVSYQGREQTIKEWAKELDMEPRRIWERLKRGWTVERTFTTACPKNYEQGRGDAIERAKRLWVEKGKTYSARSSARKDEVG